MADKDLGYLLENLFSDLPIEDIQPLDDSGESAPGPLEGLLSHAADSIAEALIITDSDGTIHYANPAVERITGYTPEELVGRSTTLFWSDQQPDPHFQEMWLAIRSEQRWHGELSNRRRDGEPLAVEIHSTEMHYQGQDTWVSIIREFTGSQPATFERAKLLATLGRRNTLLQAVAHVSRAISSILSLDDLLTQVADLIREHLDLYYAGIFLLEESERQSGEPGEWAILRAGTGDAGKQMLAAGHRLEVGGASMVGWCIGNREARISLHAGEEAIRFANPLLEETRSEMALPLSSSGRVIGAMTIQDSDEAAFSQDDISILQTMADQLANAIENARLFRDSARQITELAIVNQVSQAITSTLQLDELMEVVYQQVSRLFDTTNFYIATYKEGSDRWHSIFHLESGQRQEPAWYSTESGLTGHIIRSRNPLLFRSKQEILDFHKEQGASIIGDSSQSWLGVPLISGDKVVGVMAIQDYSQEHLYGDQDLALFSTIAAQVAVALDSLRLLQETQRRAQELQVINQVGGAITSVLGLDAVLHQISDTIKTRFGHYFVGISLLEQDRLVFHGGSTIGESDTRLELMGLDLSGGPSLIALAARTGQPAVVDDVLESESYLLLDQLPDTRSELDIPIKVKGEVIGVLDVQSTRPRAFSPSDVALLQSIANQAGVAIDNARLFEQSQSARFEAEELYRINAALNAAQDYDDVLSILYSNTLLDQAQEVTVILFDRPWTGDQSPEWIDIVAQRGAPRLETGQARLPIGSLGWAMHLLEPDSPTLVENLFSDPRIDEQSRTELGHDRGVGSAVFVPMVAGRQWIGVIQGFYQQATSFPDSAVRRLFSLAGQAAITIQGMRQYKEIESHAGREQALRRVAESVGTAENLLESLPAIASNLRSLVQLDRLELASYAPGDPECHRYTVDLLDGERSTGWIPVGESVSGWVMARGKPRLDLDLSDEMLFIEDEHQVAKGLVSRITMPLQVGEQSVGSLSVLSRQRDAYSLQDVPSLQQVAAQIALALERARLVEDTRAALVRAEATYGRYLSEEWKGHLSSGTHNQGYHVSPGKLVEKEEIWTPEIERAIAKGSTVCWQEPGDDRQPSRSAIALPIRLGGQTIGVLDFYDKDRAREWTDDEKALVEELADQTALALENARLYEQTERRAAQLEMAAQVGKAVASASMLTAVELMDQAVMLVGERFAFHHVAIYLLNGKGNHAVLQAATGHAGEVMKASNYSLPADGSSAVALAIKEQEPHVVFDADQRWVPHPLLPNTRSKVAVPLISAGQMLGAMDIHSAEPAAFDRVFAAVLNTVADQIAAALVNARLFGETRQSAADQQMLFDATTVAVTTADLDSMLQGVAQIIYNRMACTDVVIMMTERGMLRQRAACGISARTDGIEVGETDQIAVGEGIIGWVALTGEPLVVGDVFQSPHYLSTVPSTLSELAVPVVVDHRVVGVINIESDRANAFDDQDLRLLQTLGGTLGSILKSMQLVEELQGAYEEIKEIDRLKSEFLANMSHELRTPLNSIIGFSRVILKGIDGPISPIQEQDLTSIYNSGRHLLGLINNVLDLSKIEAGKMDLAPEEMRVNDALDVVMSTAVGLTKDKEIKLSMDVPPDLPPVWMDPIRLRQVLLNLISNAVKFTEEGEIAIQAAFDPQAVFVQVVDTGIGINEEDMERLFKSFSQVDSSSTRRAGGSGLGLAISAQLMELQGGRIWVESEVGVGSTFSAAIPRVNESGDGPITILGGEPAEHRRVEPETSTQNQVLAKNLVLVIEDEQGVIDLYHRYLLDHDYQIVSATTGRDGIELATALADKLLAIAIDIIMPEMDGWEIIRALREHPATMEIPIIICSIALDQPRAAALGVEKYLIKPILQEDLLNALAECCPVKA